MFLFLYLNLLSPQPRLNFACNKTQKQLNKITKNKCHSKHNWIEANCNFQCTGDGKTFKRIRIIHQVHDLCEAFVINEKHKCFLYVYDIQVYVMLDIYLCPFARNNKRNKKWNETKRKTRNIFIVCIIKL